MQLEEEKMIINERKSVKWSVVKDLMKKKWTNKTSQKVFDFIYYENHPIYIIFQTKMFS